MLIIREADDCWPADFRPEGEGLRRETFAKWWGRHRERLGNLDPQIAEQWIFRHWEDPSTLKFLDFTNLSWRLESWEGDRIIRDVHARDGQCDLDYAFKIFIEQSSVTGASFKTTGTWDYPIVVLEVPCGFIDGDEEWPDVRYLLIEGQDRHSCLAAVIAKGHPAPKHDVFLICQD